MGSSRTTFEKLQRERGKKAKAELKRQKRLGNLPQPGIDDEPEAEALSDDAFADALPPEEEELSAEQLMVLVQQLHDDYDAKRIDFDTFEERKAELMARVQVD